MQDILPLYTIEHDLILSNLGDITIVFEAKLPELFTLSDQDYEAFHQALIKAVKVLPEQTIFHKQDWFMETGYKPDFTSADQSFLSRGSERFFNERPYLDHRCYIMITKKPANRKGATSLFSSLLKKSIVPDEVISEQFLHDFIDKTGQFESILNDSGYVKLRRIRQAGLAGTKNEMGLLERYCTLQLLPENKMIRDINFEKGITIGDDRCHTIL